MFKTLTLLKRKPGLSMEAFISQYEGVHARIGEKYLAGRAIHYARRFLHSPGDGEPADKPYDVAMEIWFADRAAFDRTLEALADPEVAAEIAADEERLFDRPHNRMFVLEEHESDLPAILAARAS
ncbi:EthD domain-containing protein [Sphingobium phenoxybenzoativorans]|uniref:EthD domain-containing protein n=1 Tax=Sphingobium phenoxybenzoativorans TaxID=1592790 RepID=A0A975K3B9_9SPHN|nr:EthD domain-containing protein [Sphingobium phenoxybenzoativorans]QUT04141.1 EthD domain-containing protein [Sphingobium phenoxybenzoativorans]